MSNAETAKKLLAWNTANLNADASWEAQDLAMYFTQTFIVMANGRRYDANYHNYTEFLNTMRMNLKSIQYDFEEFIESDQCVVIPLTATLTDLHYTKDIYTAILILKFDPAGKINVWHEVYVKLETNN